MIKILKPGLLTTIQDLGRIGYQKYGVIVSGVMDQLSHRLANLLVGNAEHEATMEITLLGPKILFEEDALISICGAYSAPTIEGQPVQLWRPIFVKKGSVLLFGPCQTGCRTYLAIAGGYQMPKVMGSKSTYLRAGLGGFMGRALQAGDQLNTGQISSLAKAMLEQLAANSKSQSFSEADWAVSSDLLPAFTTNTLVRVVKGRQFDWFTEQSLTAFFSDTFKITSESDRMGYRIKGPLLITRENTDMISEAVSFGTIQVPAEGHPIILLADRQTTGGYPKLAEIISVDLPIVAQLRPGETIQFIEVNHKEAEALFLNREERLLQIKQGIKLKMRKGS